MPLLEVWYSSLPVSIPDRDFSGFQDYHRMGAAIGEIVSIPDRDFSGFPGLLSGRLAVFGFQGTFPRTSLILSS